MRGTTSIAVTAILTFVELSACKSNPKLPPPIGGHKQADVYDAGNFAPFDAGPIDAGPVTDEDGGSDSLGHLTAGECHNVDPVHFINEDTSADGLSNATVSPTDFSVTRVVGTWEASCVEPTLRIEMSDGACPDGKEHKLVFWINTTAIEKGRIRIGQNILSSEQTDAGPVLPDLRVRYTRPASFPPAGDYGTCGDVTGELSLIGTVATTAHTKLQGSFQLLLPPCDGGTGEAQSVIGTFQVELARGRAEVCPDAM